MAFLDDLNDKVKYYKMLQSADEAYNLIQSDEFRFYFEIFIGIDYNHPKPLFFRILIEYANKKIEKSTAINIIVQITKYMLKTLSISGKDSKDVISMFSNIMNNMYKNENKDNFREFVNSEINSDLQSKNIKDNDLKDDIKTKESYKKNKALTYVLLSLYESFNEEGNDKVSYDRAYNFLKELFSNNKIYSLDHLLPQNPNKESNEYKYWKEEKDNILKLKNNNDFPLSALNIHDEMDYDKFTEIILNKIGNLRIICRSENAAKSNQPSKYKKYDHFFDYKDIEERGNDIANLLVDKILK